MRSSAVPTGSIPGLKWATVEPPITISDLNGAVEISARLRGRLERSDWGLTWIRRPDKSQLGQPLLPPERQKLSSESILEKGGSFYIDLPIQAAKTSFEMVAIGPRGEVEVEAFLVVFSKWNEISQSKAAAVTNAGVGPQLIWKFMPSFGVTSLVYRETGIADFSQIVLTGKIALDLLLSLNPSAPPRWSLGANVYVNLFSVSASRTNVSARFLGVNIRAGYVLPWLTPPWELAVMAGAFYSQMFVTGGAFGYQPLLYPQLYPVFRWSLSTRDSVFMAAKYVPITGFFQGEMAVSLGCSHKKLLRWKTGRKRLESDRPSCK